MPGNSGEEAEVGNRAGSTVITAHDAFVPWRGPLNSIVATYRDTLRQDRAQLGQNTINLRPLAGWGRVYVFAKFLPKNWITTSNRRLLNAPCDRHRSKGWEIHPS